MLGDNAFFSGADAASLARVAPVFRLLTVPAGTTLYRRGSVARRVFLILSGRVALVRRVAGTRAVVTRLGAGEFTGEGALLLPPAREPWSAVCCCETRLAVAAGDVLAPAIAALPHFGYNVASGVHRRVADAASAIGALVAAR